MNRPLLTAGISTGKQHLVLDKVCILAEWKSYVVTKGEQGELTIPVLNNHPDIHQWQFAKFPYRHNLYNPHGVTLQLAEMKAHVPAVRIEWNPTNQDMDTFARSILKHTRDRRPSRLDIALDYFDADLSDFIMTTKTARKTTAYYAESGRLETLYLGGRDCSEKYRIYDKAKEQGISDLLWWRIEKQLRISNQDPWQFKMPNLLDDLYITRPSGSLEPRDRLVLDGLHRNPEIMGMFTRDLRNRYRRMIKDADLCTPLDPMPRDVYLDQLQGMVNQINSYVKGDL